MEELCRFIFVLFQRTQRRTQAFIILCAFVASCESHEVAFPIPDNSWCALPSFPAFAISTYRGGLTAYCGR